MTAQHSVPTSDLERLLRVLRRRRWLILLCVLAAAGSAVGFSVLQEKEYTAKALLLFRDPALDQRLFQSSATPSVDQAREAATNLRLVSVPRVADRTANRLNGVTSKAVQAKVDVKSEGQSDIVAVTATDSSAEFAATLANTFAQQYIAIRRGADRSAIRRAQRLVQRRLDDLGGDPANRRELQARADDLKILAALQTGKAELAQPATVPSSPTSPKPVRNGLLGGVIGLVLGLGLAFLIDRLDRRIKDVGELKETYGLPVLGAVPEIRAPRKSASGKNGAVTPGPEWEAFRKLRARLRYFNVDRDIHSLLVMSAAPEEGKTTIASHLAIATAMSGQASVLLLEADLRMPRLAERYDLAPSPGLAEVLTHEIPASEVTQRMPVPRWSSGYAEVDVIVAGAAPPNPSELMESRKMSTLLADLGASYDLVIIDTPPGSLVSDATPLVQQVDGVIVVCWLHASRRDRALHLRNELESLKAPTLGLVVNRAKTGLDGDYGYKHSFEESELKARPSPPSTMAQMEALGNDGNDDDSDVRGMLREWIEAMFQDGKPREEAQFFLKLFKQGENHLDLLDEVYAERPGEVTGKSPAGKRRGRFRRERPPAERS
jgi:polysaccharide biosynthesis transport protein